MTIYVSNSLTVKLDEYVEFLMRTCHYNINEAEIRRWEVEYQVNQHCNPILMKNGTSGTIKFKSVLQRQEIERFVKNRNQLERIIKRRKGNKGNTQWNVNYIVSDSGDVFITAIKCYNTFSESNNQEKLHLIVENILNKYLKNTTINESYGKHHIIIKRRDLKNIINECVGKCLRKYVRGETNNKSLNEALLKNNPFKRWFGDWENDPENSSKVVDSNGRPLIVYHGTTVYQDGKPFTQFKFQKEGWNGGTNSTGYFTDSISVAIFFANVESGCNFRNRVSSIFQEINPNSFSECLDFLNQYIYGDAKIITKPFSYKTGDKHLIGVKRIEGKEAVVLRYYESLENKYKNVVLGYTDEDENDLLEKLKKFIKTMCSVIDRSVKMESDYEKHGIVYPCYLNIRNPYVFDAKGKRHNELDWERLDNIAISNGCDGLIVKNVIEATIGYYICTDYKVFNPKQIKHAYDNVKFSGNIDILKGSVSRTMSRPFSLLY